MTRFLDTLPGDVSPGIREKQRPGATPLEEAKRETPRQASQLLSELVTRRRSPRFRWSTAAKQ